MSRVLMISSDCHAGALPDTYKAYMPRDLHNAVDAWWLQYAREMMVRMEMEMGMRSCVCVREREKVWVCVCPPPLLTPSEKERRDEKRK